MNCTPPQIFLKQKKNQYDMRQKGACGTYDKRQKFTPGLVVKTEGPAKLAKSSLHVTITADLS